MGTTTHHTDITLVRGSTSTDKSAEVTLGINSTGHVTAQVTKLDDNSHSTDTAAVTQCIWVVMGSSDVFKLKFRFPAAPRKAIYVRQDGHGELTHVSGDDKIRLLEITNQIDSPIVCVFFWTANNAQGATTLWIRHVNETKPPQGDSTQLFRDIVIDASASDASPPSAKLCVTTGDIRLIELDGSKVSGAAHGSFGVRIKKHPTSGFKLKFELPADATTATYDGNDMDDHGTKQPSFTLPNDRTTPITCELGWNGSSIKPAVTITVRPRSSTQPVLGDWSV